MFKYTVKYKDFLDNDREKTLYFTIPEAETIRMIAKEMNVNTEDENLRFGLKNRIEETVASGNGGEIIALFDEFLQASYGVIKDDGETFERGPEVYKAWTQTASYQKFYETLMTDTDLMIKFVNGIFPADQMAEIQSDPEFKRHQEELEKRSRGEQSL